MTDLSGSWPSLASQRSSQKVMPPEPRDGQDPDRCATKGITFWEDPSEARDGQNPDRCATNSCGDPSLALS